MASHSKRGEKYQIRWRDPDGTNRAYTCPDLRTTHKIRRQIEEAEALGEIWRSPRQTEIPSLLTLCDAYITEVRRLRAPGTAEQREIAIANFLEFLGADEKNWRGPRELTRANLSAFFDWMVRERGVSQSYAGANTRKIELWWRWLEDSDEYASVVPRPKRLELPAALPIPAAVAPTWEEMDRAVDAAGSLRRLFVLLRYTGLRCSQAMGLQWDDVDMEGASLNIRPALGKTRAEKAGRRIPISPHLVEELAGWGRREGPLVPGERRDPTHYLTVKPWSAAKVRPEVWKTREEDGRRVFGHPTHAFRKGIETGLIGLKADLLAVEYLLGHKLPGVMSSYMDPSSLPLAETVALIPVIGEAPKVRTLTTGEEQGRSRAVRAAGEGRGKRRD